LPAAATSPPTAEQRDKLATLGLIESNLHLSYSAAYDLWAALIELRVSYSALR
jgi:hypothetical protein